MAPWLKSTVLLCGGLSSFYFYFINFGVLCPPFTRGLRVAHNKHLHTFPVSAVGEENGKKESLAEATMPFPSLLHSELTNAFFLLRRCSKWYNLSCFFLEQGAAKNERFVVPLHRKKEETPYWIWQVVERLSTAVGCSAVTWVACPTAVWRQSIYRLMKMFWVISIPGHLLWDAGWASLAHQEATRSPTANWVVQAVWLDLLLFLH